ncbi:Crp/Fnr family transcriptional regulator [Nocardia farcinica]|nr:Crp/Fnr family transcriptional regulator [Nocardia farcinica]MBF6522938.1 Crp/Fnr family transcriptional regulator [Nocardia farcinica]
MTPSDAHDPGRAAWPVGTFLARLSPSSRDDLLSVSRPRRVDAGEVLIQQGQARCHVFVLGVLDSPRSACAKITATARNGAETLLGIRVGGDVVGELAALRGTYRSATVTTCSNTVVGYVDQADFVAFLNTHPDGWETMCRMIADRLDWANRRRLDFAGYDVPRRLARVLLELAERHGEPEAEGHALGVGLSQSEMGMLIGAGPDAIGLALRQLRRAGLVTTTYRALRITDLDGLRRFAD